MVRIGRIGPALAFLACLPAGRAQAQEYCVVCTEPDVQYRCVIDGAQPRGGQSLQMLCVTAMAKEGGHATCSVKGGTVFACNGAVKRVPWTALNAPRQPDQPLPWTPQPAPKPEPAAAPPPAGGGGGRTPPRAAGGSGR